MLIFSAAFSISRRCGSGSIRHLCLAATFAPRPRIWRVPHLALWSHSSPQIYLYNLGDHSTALQLDREISLPDITGLRCIGSSHGFVIALSVEDEGDEVVAVNPLSRKKLHLPPLPRYTDEPESFRSCAQLHSKITLSPSLDLAFLIRRTTFITAPAYFARLTPRVDAWWTPILSPLTDYEDCVFNKGRFIAVNDFGDLATLKDAGDPSNPREALYHSSNLEYTKMKTSYRKYLVESPDGNELFLVNRDSREEFREEEDGNKRKVLIWTRGFRVWRLEKNDFNYMWKPVETLGGLAFFVGPNRSFSMPAADFPCLNPDSIYFTTGDLCAKDSGLPHMDGGLGDTGVFDLQDGTIQLFQLPDTRNGVDWLHPTWFVPVTC